MTIPAKIGSTFIQIGSAALITGALIPPGDVPRQLLVAATWFVAGAISTRVWFEPRC